MAANVIWWSAIAIEAVILLRGASTKLIRRYSLFYGYLGCVLITEIIRLCCFELVPNLYPTFYWHTELATIVASYAVIIEVFRHALRYNLAASHVTRTLLWIILVMTGTYAALDLLPSGFSSLPRATADLGRYLRYVEGSLLLALLWLLLRYRISFGRNILGIALGNSLWIGINVMNMALVSLRGNEFSVFFRRLAPANYLVTLTIWCVSLWSAQIEPAPAATEIDRDYEFLATKTRSMLASASNRLVRSLKP
jgi:hypothetical protein